MRNDLTIKYSGGSAGTFDIEVSRWPTPPRSIRDIVRRERWETAFEKAVAMWPRIERDDGKVVVAAQLVCLERGYNCVITMDDDETPVALGPLT